MSKVQLFYMENFEKIVNGKIYEIGREEYGNLKTFMLKVSSYLEDNNIDTYYMLLRTKKDKSIIFQLRRNSHEQ